MIKESTYIRNFTQLQRRQLEAIAAAHPELKTVPAILFYALANYVEMQQDNARLHRIIALKQKKIEKMQNSESEIQTKIEQK